MKSISGFHRKFSSNLIINNYRIGRYILNLLKLKYHHLLLLFIAVSYLGVQRIHETGHWVIFELFQRGPTIGFTGLVQSWEMQPSDLTHWQAYTYPLTGEQGWFHLTSLPSSGFEWVTLMMMGQIFQILTILIGIIVLRRTQKLLLKTAAFIVIILNAFGQVVYTGMKLRHVPGGDESFAAYFMQISPRAITGTLAVFYGITLIYFLYRSGGWKERLTYLSAAILSMIIGPVLGYCDRIVLEQSLLENPLVQSIFGFSLPVVLLDILASLGLWLLLRRIQKTAIPG